MTARFWDATITQRQKSIRFPSLGPGFVAKPVMIARKWLWNLFGNIWSKKMEDSHSFLRHRLMNRSLHLGTSRVIPRGLEKTVASTHTRLCGLRWLWPKVVMAIARQNCCVSLIPLNVLGHLWMFGVTMWNLMWWPPMCMRLRIVLGWAAGLGTRVPLLGCTEFGWKSVWA